MAEGDFSCVTIHHRSDVNIARAEPGWRVVLTNGEDAFLLDIIAWEIVSHVWPGEKEGDYNTVDTYGKALVLTEGAELVTAQDAATNLRPGWKVCHVLAPGKQLGDSPDGWTKVGWPPEKWRTT